MAEDKTNPLPSQVLRSEHQKILSVFQVLRTLAERYERGEGFESDAIKQCIEFFQLFADACHHGKEEDLLFPMLEMRGVTREGGPIGVMLHEHRLGREYVRRMAEAFTADKPRECIAAGRDFVGLLSQHIFKEDNILFNMADRVLSAADQEELARSFCHVQCRNFQGRTREQLESLADSLVRAWGEHEATRQEQP